MLIVYSFPGVARFAMTAVLVTVEHDVVASTSSSAHTRQLLASPEFIQLRSNRFVCLDTTVKFDAGDGSLVERRKTNFWQLLDKRPSCSYLVHEDNVIDGIKWKVRRYVICLISLFNNN
jgi:hypothetical protein